VNIKCVLLYVNGKVRLETHVDFYVAGSLTLRPICVFQCCYHNLFDYNVSVACITSVEKIESPVCIYLT
jgi:hypothetical protein